jgi:periodic tryptophan protein 1
VFSATFSPDDPLTVAAGGSKAKMQVWDVAANGSARNAFGSKLQALGARLKEARNGSDVIGVVSDDEGSEEDQGES